MQRRFFSGMNPPEFQKRLYENTTAPETIFHRVNLSLASCSSAVQASVWVLNKIHFLKLYLQLVEKTSHFHYNYTVPM